ncbi:unnamed protein product [Mycena citricolor]|uniref:Arrestin-like N-terminal domain-containing protein n=1 Tax=Mycena citricolor TaxID=2018698 RepID=A0AAD2H3K3_9AGAR|nr:unnamed protein product [Mycena citricolor]
MAFPPPRPLRNAFAEANASSADGRDHIGEVIDPEASSNPSSEPLPPAKEFACHLVHNKSKKAWATLSVLGDTVQSKGSPAILQDTPISGEVRLDLGSGESIHSIILLLRGQVITGATPSEMFTFFELPTTLWTRSMGDPRNPSVSDRPTKWGEKLKGAYTWPFSVTLPATVTLPVGRREEVFPLPQTFFERHTRARIKYELSVRFQRTGLRTDHRLSTTLNYLPVSRPGPASRLRQLSYQQHTALLGPDADPEGWHAFPVVKTRGRLPGCPSTEVKCTYTT